MRRRLISISLPRVRFDNSLEVLLLPRLLLENRRSDSSELRVKAPLIFLSVPDGLHFLKNTLPVLVSVIFG